MNANNAAKIGGPVAAAGAAGAAALNAPILIGAAVALVVAGGVCAALGALASNSKDTNLHADKNGVDVSFKK